MSDQSLPQPDLQPLNAMDRAMVALDRVLRSLGSPGNETQTLIWLTGRADRQRLQTSISRISQNYPVVAARLVEPDDDHVYWQLRAGAECELGEVHLESSDTQSVWDFAGQTLSTPCDPAECDPIRFFLVHLPAGRDVLLMQYNHALLDNNAISLVLAEMDRLSQGAEVRPPAPVVQQRDALAEYLQRYPYERQMRAARHVYELRDRFMQGRRLVLREAELPRGQPLGVRIAARSLDAATTQQLQTRVVQACGLPSIAMGLLASALRVLSRLASESSQEFSVEWDLLTDLGVDLGLRKTSGSLFQTLASMVPLRARWGELNDWDALVQMMSRQLRQRLAEEADLGLIQLVSLPGGQRRLMRWYRRSIEYGVSMWYAYFGSLGAVGPQWCGSEVESVSSAGTACPPWGLTLLANSCFGRTHLQLTYIAELISDELAQEFLDQVVEDLVNVSQKDG